MNNSDKPAFNFSNGVRGKHAKAMREGFTTTIHHADGSKTIEVSEPPANVVFLDRDVAAIFNSSEKVNNVLRSIIEATDLAQSVSAD